MRKGIHGNAPMHVLVFKPDVQAPFIGSFRCGSFFRTKFKIIIDSSMKIGNEFSRIGSFVRNQRADPLYFPEKMPSDSENSPLPI